MGAMCYSLCPGISYNHSFSDQDTRPWQPSPRSMMKHPMMKDRQARERPRRSSKTYSNATLESAETQVPALTKTIVTSRETDRVSKHALMAEALTLNCCLRGYMEQIHSSCTTCLGFSPFPSNFQRSHVSLHWRCLVSSPAQADLFGISNPLPVLHPPVVLETLLPHLLLGALLLLKARIRRASFSANHPLLFC